MSPKVCPECREEYVHAASVCVHCEVPLILEGDLFGGDDEIEDLPPASELVCIRAASVAWATQLSERLSEAEIPHRIQAAGSEDDDGDDAGRRPGHDLPYGVFVLPEDVETALEIDAEHTGSQIPDIPEDYDLATISSDSCPACGEPIDEYATECAECGLALLLVD